MMAAGLAEYVEIYAVFWVGLDCFFHAYLDA